MSTSSPSGDMVQANAFQILKPKCVAISKLVLQAHVSTQANSELATALESLISTLKHTASASSTPLSKGLGEYVFFPLTQVFLQPHKFTDRVRELGLQCISILVESCWGTPGVEFEADLAKQLTIMVTFIVGGKPGSSNSSSGKESLKISDETKTAGCVCLRAIFTSLAALQKDKRKWMVEAANIPVVGHCVTTLLDEVVGSRETALQVAATEALDLLVVDCIDDEDVRASFFPGTISQVCKSLDPRTSGKRLSKSLAAGVRFLGRTIAAVLEDAKTEKLGEAEASSKGKKTGEFAIAQRTSSWLRATASQVGVAITGVLRLRTHRQVLVRQAVFEMCLKLVKECFTSLQGSMMTIIESMVLLAADKDEQLSSTCISSLREVATSKEGFSDILQSSLQGWITSFPRLMTSQDDDKKTRTLQEISISFKILDELSVNSEVLQDQLSRNLSDALSGQVSSTAEHRVELASTEISANSLDLIPVTSTMSSRVGAFDPIILAEPSQVGVAKSIKDVQHMLGKSSSAFPIIRRHVREAARGDHVNQCTSLWIATNVLRSSMEDDDDWLVDPHKVATQKQLLYELCSVALNNLLKTYDDASTTSLSSASSLSTCVALEAISFAAENMKEDFRLELVDALYPIVHLLGSRDAAVQNHAMVCLNNVSLSCGYVSARECLLENVDYLVNAVSLKLNVFDVSPQAPTVLLMMIRLAGPSLVPYLDDIVSSIFAALDNFHGYAKLTELLFAVLTGIVEESAWDGRRQFLITGGEKNMAEEDLDDVKKITLPSLEDFLQELDKRKVISSRSLKIEEVVKGGDGTTPFPTRPWGPGKTKEKPKDIFDGLEEEDDDESPDGDNKKVTTQPKEPTTTPTYKTIQSIAKLSQHYLTHPSPTLRSLILGLVSTASPLLAMHKDSFLPLVNELWPMIVLSLSDNNDTIVIAALDAISALCRNAKTFMSGRINEVWPTLHSVFSSAKRKLIGRGGTGSSSSRGKEVMKQRAATYTPEYKAWCACLRLFGDLLRFTVLEDEKFDDMVEIVADDLFNNHHNNHNVNTAEANLLKELKDAIGEVNADVLWLEEARSRRKDNNVATPFKTPGEGFMEVSF